MVRVWNYGYVYVSVVDNCWITERDLALGTPKPVLEQKSFAESSTYHYKNMPIQIYWKVNRRKIENFQTKNSNIFHISAQNIDCGYSLEPPRRGGSNEYPQSMFLSRNKKNNVYPCKPQFYYIKVGFKGVKII